MVCPRLLLDEHGDSPVPSGYTLVDDEATFLRIMLEAERLQVRGARLCEWAAAVAQARGWTATRVTSPLRELQESCPELEEAHARDLIAALGVQLAHIERPLTAFSVARRLWSEAPIWGSPSAQHAFHWLEWLIHSSFTSAEAVLLRALATRWMTTAPELTHIYQASSAEAAWEQMQGWLGGVSTAVSWPAFPEPAVPGWVLARLKQQWRLPSATDPDGFFDGLTRNNAHRDLLHLAARLVASSYLQHSSRLTPRRLEELESYLDYNTLLQLRGAMLVEDPGAVPESLSDAMTWFVKRYLPYREQESRRGDAVQRQRVAEIARDFGAWYLSLYAQACVGGMGAQQLSWRRVAQMVEDQDGMKLLVVLDGMGYRDAQQLVGFIQEQSSRLTLDSLDIALAPLPTVTSFAKPSLMRGLPPQLAQDAQAPGATERKDEAVIEALKADPPARLVIWTLVEPDKTYHQYQTPETAQIQVRGQLHSIAERITRIAHHVPEERRLRIIITTDHGRLLNAAERRVAVPAGMEAHGRAAWGTVNKVFDERGVIIEGDLAYLDPYRFSLPSTVAIVLSGDAFVTASGATGSEPFPHGGVYPEEVFIPWLIVSRDRQPVVLHGTVSGTGIAGTPGVLKLQIVNPSDVAVQLKTLELADLASFDLEHQPIAPRTSVERTLTLMEWPSQRVAALLRCNLRYRLPAGDLRMIELPVQLESEELYSQDDILSDLGGL